MILLLLASALVLILAACGGSKAPVPERIIADCPEIFTAGVDFSRCNAIMVDKPGHAHNYANWIVDLYNTLVCFFC